MASVACKGKTDVVTSTRSGGCARAGVAAVAILSIDSCTPSAEDARLPACQGILFLFFLERWQAYGFPKEASQGGMHETEAQQQSMSQEPASSRSEVVAAPGGRKQPALTGVHLKHWLQLLLTGLGALLAILFGMSIPSHFRSVSPLVLEAANAGTPGLAATAAAYLDAGQPGRAQPLLRLLGREHPDTIPLSERQAALLRQFPHYRWSGGPAPFYEAFLQQAPFLREDEPSVLASLLPAENRSRLLGFLQSSPSQIVQRMLAMRGLGGWQIFFPVNSVSGQPLDAAILTLALLEQSSALQGDLRAALLSDIELSHSGDATAQLRLEALLAALLTLGRHSDWHQLEHWFRNAPDREALLFAAAAIQEDPQRQDLLFALLALQADPTAIATYTGLHADSAWRALRTASVMGSGAVQSLLAIGKPLYQPPAIWYRIPERIRASQNAFKGFAESAPAGALVVRVAAFALCGFLLVGMLRGVVLGPQPRGRRSRTLWQLDRLAGAAVVTILLWVLIEPGLLEFHPNQQGVLQIQLAQLLPDSPPDTSSIPMIDQVTIIVLVLFFVLQLFVFLFGLLKMAEIRRLAVSAAVKLRLLDNEENLFDLGLYVGLGGTVSSLILIVLQFVDASLMAAYASTLFGILFVGILKVGFVRPFRRSLVLASSGDTAPGPTPQPQPAKAP